MGPMNPRSMANRALLILVMAKGMQKGFIFLKDCRPHTHTHKHGQLPGESSMPGLSDVAC